MAAYLLDTNVVSEALARHPDATALRWIREHQRDEQYISVLTIGEMRRGIALLQQRKAESAARLAQRVDQIEAEFADRTLVVDLAVMSAWAALPTARTLPVIDALLAATATAHDLVLVTRNVRDVADLGVRIVNPWDKSTW
jgi:predicted nucleic acid-binding protein